MKICVQKLLNTNIEKMSPFGSEHMLMKTQEIEFSSEYVDETKGDSESRMRRETRLLFDVVAGLDVAPHSNQASFSSALFLTCD